MSKRQTPRRSIVPVSSGKGGVGKSTIATNLALGLALQGRTILIDLDPGTSTVRRCFRKVTPVRDLYHFFRKDEPLERCITPLPKKLDPHGLFADFGFIASPAHFIEDITNFSDENKSALIRGINELDARYVVLDLKAGLDANVVDFLPFSNSGILVLTPHNPAATHAASDMVKAILFRKLRLLFAPESPFYSGMAHAGYYSSLIGELIQTVEDPYDLSIRNLDHFVADLRHALGDHPVIERIESTLQHFKVYFVLNMFNEVEESYNQAVAPFVSNIVENVSAKIKIRNLGWIQRDAAVDRSNTTGRPLLLEHLTPARKSRTDRSLGDLDNLLVRHGKKKPPEAPPKPPPGSGFVRNKGAEKQLMNQFDSLKRLYIEQKEASSIDNFQFIIDRICYVLRSNRVTELGDERIFSRAEIVDLVFRSIGSDTPGLASLPLAAPAPPPVPPAPVPVPIPPPAPAAPAAPAPSPASAEPDDVPWEEVVAAAELDFATSEEPLLAEEPGPAPAGGAADEDEADAERKWTSEDVFQGLWIEDE